MGGRTDARTDAWTENIYSIFRDKLLLLGEHVFASLSLLNATSSLVSAMELPGLKSPWSSIHSFHALSLGKSLSAFFCRLTLLRRFTVRKAWMNWHIAFLFKSTASSNFFSASTAKLKGQFSLVGSLNSKLGSKHLSNHFSIRCAIIFISQMVQSSPWLPLHK